MYVVPSHAKRRCSCIYICGERERGRERGERKGERRGKEAEEGRVKGEDETTIHMQRQTLISDCYTGEVYTNAFVPNTHTTYHV